MTIAAQFQSFFDSLRFKSIWTASRLFLEEPVVKFYHLVNGKQKIELTFADQSVWEGEETVNREIGGL
jgi:hypothetical protein